MKIHLIIFNYPYSLCQAKTINKNCRFLHKILDICHLAFLTREWYHWVEKVISFLSQSQDTEYRLSLARCGNSLSYVLLAAFQSTFIHPILRKELNYSLLNTMVPLPLVPLIKGGESNFLCDFSYRNCRAGATFVALSYAMFGLYCRLRENTTKSSAVCSGGT